MNGIQRVSEQNPFAVAERTSGQTTTALVEGQRAVQEVQAALVIAKRFPRDEFQAIERIKTACQRQSLAEIAEYEYSRGGTRITGPTVDLLKAIASRWGNVAFGWKEIERRDGQSIVYAYAWDQQTNARSEITFTVRHWRDTKGGGHAVTDERDVYEVVANVAARRMRACMESVIDSDVIDTAVDECRKTLAGGNKEPLVDRVRAMVAVFRDHFQVTVEMLEKRLGNKLEAVSENQLASLRRVYKSLKDGVGKREDYFKVSPEATGPADLGDEKAEAEAGLAPSEAKAAGKVAEKVVERVVEKAKRTDQPAKEAPAAARAAVPQQKEAAEEPEGEGPPPGQPIDRLLWLMERDGIDEVEVLDICRRKKLAKPTQTELMQLADVKLESLVQEWELVRAQVKIDRQGKADEAAKAAANEVAQEGGDQ